MAESGERLLRCRRGWTIAVHWLELEAVGGYGSRFTASYEIRAPGGEARQRHNLSELVFVSPQTAVDNAVRLGRLEVTTLRGRQVVPLR
jgi:hypothetical protein